MADYRIVEMETTFPQEEGDKFVTRVALFEPGTNSRIAASVEYDEPDGFAYAWYHGPTAGLAVIEGVPDPNPE